MKTLARPRDKAEIVRRLKEIRPESSRRWGRMTAHQMICHLSDSFRMVLGEKPVSPVAGPFPRTIVKWVALYLPVTWPVGIPTMSEIDQGRGGTLPGDFTLDVARLEALLDFVASEPRSFPWPSHPLFGRMSDAAWLRWGYLHMDHHLRQFSA